MVRRRWLIRPPMLAGDQQLQPPSSDINPSRARRPTPSWQAVKLNRPWPRHAGQRLSQPFSRSARPLMAASSNKVATGSCRPGAPLGRSQIGQILLLRTLVSVTTTPLNSCVPSAAAPQQCDVLQAGGCNRPRHLPDEPTASRRTADPVADIRSSSRVKPSSTSGLRQSTSTWSGPNVVHT